MTCTGANHRHVAVIAFPFGSHPTPLFFLARALAAASPGVTISFLTSAQSAASLSKSGDRPDNIRFCHVDDGSGAAPTTAAGMNVPERIGLFLKAAPGNLKAGIEAAEKEAGGVKVSCVVSDAFLWMAGDVAEDMRVPWVALWPGATAGLIAHLYTDELRQAYGIVDNGIHPRAEEPIDIIPCLSTIRIRDLPEGILSSVDSPFAGLLYHMVKQLPRAFAVALNTIQGLEPSFDAEFSSIFKNSLAVGPLNILAPSPSGPDSSESLLWLDQQELASVIYISFGMISSLPPSELAELAYGLEESGFPFIWSLKDTESLPAGFLDRTRGRGLVMAWAPQVRILEHTAVGAFVTHCGWNSVMECVAAGLPMICRPVFADHMMAERVMSHVWKTGVGFEDGVITKGELMKALNKVLKEEEGEKMRERCLELKMRAVQAVGHSGTSANNLSTLLEIVYAKG